jgi:hypothetical protein
MNTKVSRGIKAGLIFIIHKFHQLQKHNKMEENKSGQQGQGGLYQQPASQGPKGGNQNQESRTSRKSSGKEDERGRSSSGRGESNNK